MNNFNYIKIPNKLNIILFKNQNKNQFIYFIGSLGIIKINLINNIFSFIYNQNNLLKFNKKIYLFNSNKKKFLKNYISSNEYLTNSNILLKNLKIQNNKLINTYISLINNIFIGIQIGFIKKLELNGIGYNANIINKKNKNFLLLKLGFSNKICIAIPIDIKIVLLKNNFIYLFGIDKQQLNQISANIRNFKKPDNYKGKGIKYDNEIIKLKSTNKN